jgi:hypothetical protein
VAPPAVTAPPAAARSRGGLVAALLGLAALLGAAGFLFLSAGDDGDGGEDATTVDDGTTTTVGSTSTTDPFAAIEGVFVDDCVAGQPGLGDAADDFCRCTFTAIRDNIPFDRYLELEAETEPDGTPPAEIGEVIQPCIDEFS